MRLLNPNPGECIDRQTILHLKCKAGDVKGLHVQPFVDEINHIQTYLEKNWFTLVPKSIQHDYDTLYKQLTEVNQQLWNLEDEIRALAAQYSEYEPVNRRLAEVACLIPKLNDERSALVQKINLLFGIRMQEKIYSNA